MGRFFKKKDDKNVKKRGSGLFKRRKFCRFSLEKMDGIDYKDIDLFKTKPFLAVLQFAGSEPMVSAEQEMALAIAKAQGGEPGPDGPYLHWKQNRYVAYSQKWHDAGYFNDTIEVTGNWSALPTMYDAIAKAVREIHPGVHFGVPMANYVGWAVVGAISLLIYFPLDRRLNQPLPQHRPSITHRLLLGGGLYYGVLAFNLAMTFWIGETLQGTTGLLMYVPVTAILLLRLLAPATQSA